MPEEISSHVLGALKEMLSGPVLRQIVGLIDTGEAFWAEVLGDHKAHDKKRDVMTMVADALTGNEMLARLFAPAGILWNRPAKGERAVVIRPRKTQAPGSAVAMHVGGNGKDDNVVPDWLDDDNAGIYTKKTAHLESTDKDVKIEAKASGKKILIGSSSLKKAARLNDEVDLGTWQATFGAGPLATCIIQLSVTPPGGGTPIVFVLATPGPFPLKGKISQGSDKVELE